LHYYGGYFYGLWKGTHLWRVKSGTIEGTNQALTYPNYTDPITHSKDDIMYIATDNVVRTFDGTTLATGITLPSSFTITSISEQGDFLFIVGYDGLSGISVGYLWDRDATLATLTAKYDLGEARVKHGATLGGTPFIVSVENVSTGLWPYLAIGYIINDQYKLLKKYPFRSIIIGEKYATGDNLYFTASVIFETDAAGVSNQGVLFRLDQQGRLFIEQALATTDNSGLIKNGDFFWVGGDTGEVGFNSANNFYVNECSFETTKYSADDMTKNLSLTGAIVSFDPLSSAGRVRIYYRVNENTSWTELADFTGANTVKGSVNGDGGIIGKTIQFKIVSTGKAIINGFQADFEEINDEVYG
jgi:hypothetical protein